METTVPHHSLDVTPERPRDLPTRPRAASFVWSYQVHIVGHLALNLKPGCDRRLTR